EDPRRKHGYGCTTLAVSLGADICRKRQFADIEFQVPHHAAERLDQNGNIFVFDLKASRLDDAVLNQLRVSKGAKNRFQLSRFHNGCWGEILPCSERASICLGQTKNFEIGRVLHLKSAIRNMRNLKLDLPEPRAGSGRSQSN